MRKKEESKVIPNFAPWLGVFETLKVINGRVLFFKEHALSLKESAAVMGLRAPSEKVLQKIQIPRLSGRLRWIVDTEGFRFLFNAEKMGRRSAYILGVSQVRVGSQNWDARYKTVSYLSHWQARMECETVDEVVLLNEWDEIATVSMANIFWVKNGVVYTPSIDCGCRKGVVRQWIQKQVRVKEGGYGLDQLAEAEEIFLTNSMLGVQPVCRFLGRAFRKGKQTSLFVKKWNEFLI